MKIAVLNAGTPFVHGGAEYLAEGLARQLIAKGHRAEVFSIPMGNDQGENILDRMHAFSLLHLDTLPEIKVDVAIALKFPTFQIPHPHRIFWVLHQYRAAYDLWDRGLGQLRNHPHGSLVREKIIVADNLALTEAKAVFAQSETVAGRLARYNDFHADVVYPPPPSVDSYFSAPAADYVLCVSRFNSLKRQHLLIEALAHTRAPVKLVLAGADVRLRYYNQLRESAARLGVEDRIRWALNISDQEKFELYARALAVAFVPVDEDYGFITLEAMLASKPVLTATDSGGSLEFVANGETGIVATPDPTSIAAGLDQLWDERDRSRQMGEAGRARYADSGISWPRAVERLLG